MYENWNWYQILSRYIVNSKNIKIDKFGNKLIKIKIKCLKQPYGIIEIPSKLLKVIMEIIK